MKLKQKIGGLFNWGFPTWAASRARARLELESLAHIRKYVGAEFSRISDDWNPGTTSADAELDGSLETLRNRSRDLNQNDPHAAAATDTMTTFTVGDRVRLQAKAKPDKPDVPLPPAMRGARTLTEDDARIANAHAEAAFATIEHDVDGSGRSFTEHLELALRQELESGESLVQFANVDRRDSPLTTAAVAIEPDRLMTPGDQISNARVVNGVEYEDDARTKIAAYWIAKQHPGDIRLVFRTNDFDRIDARNIGHSYDVKRPGQTRGVPWFTPALAYFRHKSKYQEAEIVAARIAACFAAFIKMNSPLPAAKAVADQTRTDGTRVQKFGPGQVVYLGANEEVTFGNPTRPGANFVPSLHEILRAIGTSLGIPYVILARDFENTNYSSMRAALVQFQRKTATYRERLRTRVVMPFWSRFYDEAVIAGLIVAPDYIRRRMDYQRLRVQWPAGRWVDPLREAKADILAWQSGTIPQGTVVAQSYGLDFDDVQDDIARERAVRTAKGNPQPESTEGRALVEMLMHTDPGYGDSPTGANGNVPSRLARFSGIEQRC